MSRVVNPNSTGRARNQSMRTAAEVLRRLSQKTEFDDESKDMVAVLVLALREVEDGIDQSAEVWEKRDYWIKAEQLRQRWAWAGNSAASLTNMVIKDTWDNLPAMMVSLLPHFAEITITKLTRDPEEWRGAYQRLRETLGV